MPSCTFNQIVKEQFPQAPPSYDERSTLSRGAAPSQVSNQFDAFPLHKIRGSAAHNRPRRVPKIRPPSSPKAIDWDCPGLYKYESNGWLALLRPCPFG